MNRNYADAAAELGCSEVWLRANTPKVPLPHLKFGGRNATVIFTDEHLCQIRAMFEVGSKSTELRPLPMRSRRSA